jgi:WD40 repeat protein
MAGTSRRGVFIVKVGDPPVRVTNKFVGTVHLQKELPSEVTNVAVGPGVGAACVATTKRRSTPPAAGQELWVFGADQGELRRRVDIRGVIATMDHPDDMSCVAVGSSDGRVRLLSTATGGGDWIGRHDGAVNSVAVATDGQLIATGGSDRCLRVYSSRLAVDESPEGHRPQWTSDRHPRGITRIAMSSNGKWIGTGCSDGTVQLFNAASREPRRVLHTDARVTALAFASDQTLAVGLESGVGLEGGSVQVIDVGSGQPLANLVHPAPVTAVRFNWDGSLLATGTAIPGVVRIWRATGLSERPLFSFGLETAVNDLVFCPVNNTLIVALSASNVAVIDVDTGYAGRHLFTGAATGVRFASDGSLLVVAAGARVTIYKAASTS